MVYPREGRRVTRGSANDPTAATQATAKIHGKTPLSSESSVTGTTTAAITCGEDFFVEGSTPA